MMLQEAKARAHDQPGQLGSARVMAGRKLIRALPRCGARPEPAGKCWRVPESAAKKSHCRRRKEKHQEAGVVRCGPSLTYTNGSAS